MQDLKIRWAKLSVISNAALILFKIAVGIVTGSVSIIAEGMHSGVDLIASVITYFSVRISGKKPDKRHLYGHGKFENMAGLVEGVLIFVGAGVIIWESVPKLITHEGPKSLGYGVGVMALSAAVNFAVSQKLFSVAKKADSPAIAADAMHLRTDVYTSLGVLGGLILIKLTGKPIFDPVLALLVAGFIIKAAWDITSEGFSHMVDVTLPDEEVEAVKKAIVRHGEEFIEFHDLRARKSGSKRYIDLHLVVPAGISLKKAHDICDAIEGEVGRALPNSEIFIHPEPCGQTCVECAQGTECDEAGRGTVSGGKT